MGAAAFAAGQRAAGDEFDDGPDAAGFQRGARYGGNGTGFVAGQAAQSFFQTLAGADDAAKLAGEAAEVAGVEGGLLKAGEGNIPGDDLREGMICDL